MQEITCEWMFHSFMNSVSDQSPYLYTLYSVSSRWSRALVAVSFNWFRYMPTADLTCSSWEGASACREAAREPGRWGWVWVGRGVGRWQKMKKGKRIGGKEKWIGEGDTRRNGGENKGECFVSGAVSPKFL